ncbi:MAG: serine hydrolase [Pseudomonadota bacterium]
MLDLRCSASFVKTFTEKTVIRTISIGKFPAIAALAIIAFSSNAFGAERRDASLSPASKKTGQIVDQNAIKSGSIFGRWRSLTQGPIGTGIVTIDIVKDSDGATQIYVDGQNRGLDRYKWRMRDANATTLRADNVDVSYDMYDIVGFVSGPMELIANFDQRRDLLDVQFDNHNINTNLVFERDGPKFARFDAPRLDPNGEPATDYIYSKPPKRVDDDISVAHLSDVGLDSSLFENAIVEDVLTEKYPHITSVLVMKNGKLVFEEYFNGVDADYLNYQASVTKSYISILYGPAIRDGIFTNIDDPVMNVLPEFKDTKWAKEGFDISLRDLLGMKSVVPWNERLNSFLNKGNDLNDAFEAAYASGKVDGMFQYLFNKPLLPKDTNRPSYYNTIMSYTLGLALTRQSGQHLGDYIDEQIFSPMNIRRSYWGAFGIKKIDEKDALPLAGSTLHIRSRDMVKFGQMLLNGGRWKDKQIVPYDWVVESTTLHSLMRNTKKGDGYSNEGYGYQIWLQKLSDGEASVWVFSGRGHGGQYIYMIPALDAVIVTTANKYFSGDYFKQGKDAEQLIRKRLIPALMGKTSTFDPLELTRKDIGFQPIQ